MHIPLTPHISTVEARLKELGDEVAKRYLDGTITNHRMDEIESEADA